jgi:methionyl-tRNA formyltransferase
LFSRSGPRLLPYLAINFVLPRLAGWLPRNDTTPEQTRLAPLCARYGIPSETVPDMNASEFRARLAASGADIIVTFHCDQILSAATIAALPQGGINVHAGLLPNHRGPTPTIHALLQDPPEFGITVHRLVARIDAGAILARQPLHLASATTALAAAQQLHDVAIPLLTAVLDALATGSVTEQAQAPSDYCGFPSAQQLRALARAGRRAASWSDAKRALRTPI